MAKGSKEGKKPKKEKDKKNRRSKVIHKDKESQDSKIKIARV